MMHQKTMTKSSPEGTRPEDVIRNGQPHLKAGRGATSAGHSATAPPSLTRRSSDGTRLGAKAEVKWRHSSAFFFFFFAFGFLFPLQGSVLASSVPNTPRNFAVVKTKSQADDQTKPAVVTKWLWPMVVVLCSQLLWIRGERPLKRLCSPMVRLLVSKS